MFALLSHSSIVYVAIDQDVENTKQHNRRDGRLDVCKFPKMILFTKRDLTFSSFLNFQTFLFFFK